MDLRKIKKLIDLLEESNLAEIEIKEGEESVRLARLPKGGVQVAAPPTYHPPAVAHPAAAAPVSSAPSRAPDESSAAGSSGTNRDVPDGHIQRSPMVGTFYASANPESPPFVKVGDTVKAGQTLGIIEAMKMFNPIEAEVAGTIAALLVKNGDPVEFDEPMFVIS